MNWTDYETYIELKPPKEFCFKECLTFLNRSRQEVLHYVENDILYKLINTEGKLVLLNIKSTAHSIQVDFPINKLTRNARKEVAKYVWNWFHLDANLENFYELGSQDKILKPIIHKYYGLRIIGIPDLFEALTWAIMGQQVNLNFAYKLKKRFVESFGECIRFQGRIFWIYPTYSTIATIDVESLKKLQFTTRKAEYVIGVAKIMASRELTKEQLHSLDYQQMKNTLMAIRGIGAWSADYVIMKCLYQTEAFPIADVGLHNALKCQLNMERKPTLEEIKEIFINWQDWQAYAVFYLWRSLLDAA